MKRTIIITGAAGGIGIELSKHMASLGWKVGMVDRNPEVLILLLSFVQMKQDLSLEQKSTLTSDLNLTICP